jgi:hypothetical protein
MRQHDHGRFGIRRTAWGGRGEIAVDLQAVPGRELEGFHGGKLIRSQPRAGASDRGQLPGRRFVEEVLGGMPVRERGDHLAMPRLRAARDDGDASRQGRVDAGMHLGRLRRCWQEAGAVGLDVGSEELATVG